MNEKDTDMYFGIAIVLIIISCCILYSRAYSEEEKTKDHDYYANHDSLPECIKMY